MHFARRLVPRLLAALVVPAVFGLYVFRAFRARAPAGDPDGLGAAAVVTVAALALAAWVAAILAPVRGAVRAAPEDPHERRRAAAIALGVPLRLALAVGVVGAAATFVAVTFDLRRGVAADLTLAFSAAGAALVVMAAMFSYSVASAATVPLVVSLGSVELRGRGTVRGKILAVGSGLVVIATLLAGSVSYVSFRADLDRAHLEAVAAPRLAEGARVAPAPGGWAVSAGGDAPSFVSDEPLRARRAAFGLQLVELGAALLAAAAVLVFLAARTLSDPIHLLGEAAGRVASGDLTASPPSVTRDEMGKLAADFRRMAQGLAALVQDVQLATDAVTEGTTEIGTIGERVKGGARQEHERLVGVQAAVEAMQGSVAMVGKGVGGLADYVHSTSAAVGQMSAALDEVRRQAAELERRMTGAERDAGELSQAGAQAETQLAALEGLAANAHLTLGSVSASLSGLETSAVATQLAAAQAAELADRAGGVVRETVTGIESLRSAVDDAKQRVRALGRRSDDVDKILDFIGEVAGRTNLLSLNASIIATQAGEHGKAFAVVADQIRELAAQISSSTKSIGQIIRAVREDVTGTARLIDRGDELAAEGVGHARKSLEALDELRSATAKGHETAAAIRDAVAAHGHSTRDVANLVSSIAGSSHLLGEAVGMVGKSVTAAGGVSRAARELADKVSRALEEQSGLGRQQLENLERIDRMLGDIGRAVANHDAATRRVRESLEQLTRTAEQHDGSVVELSAVSQRLGGRSRALADRVGKFKIQVAPGPSGHEGEGPRPPAR